jgi:hypothetical protein
MPVRLPSLELVACSKVLLVAVKQSPRGNRRPYFVSGAAVGLRHLRYFVAVAEEGGLTVAAG